MDFSLHPERSQSEQLKRFREGMLSILNLEVFVGRSHGHTNVQMRRKKRRQNDPELRYVPVASCSGGQKELFLVLAALCFSSSSDFFLDEPGHSLHPESLRALRIFIQKIARHRGLNVWIVTHNPEYISVTTFAGLLHCSMSAAGSTAVTRVSQQIDPKQHNQFCLPIYRRLFFSTQLLMVEGSSEQRLYAK